MSSHTLLFVALLVIGLLILLLQAIQCMRPSDERMLETRLDTLKDDNERLQRSLHEEQRAGRDELQQSFARFDNQIGERLVTMERQKAERSNSFGQRLEALTTRTDEGLKALAQRLAEDAYKGREEIATALNRFGEQQQQRLHALTVEHEKRVDQVRETLEMRLKALQQDNEKQLEKMRQTVDEKLQSTLETRLGQSFKLVSERLEAVQRGLGEMQQLATGVGDLRRVLTNVKTRGIFGEVQLDSLLQDMLTIEQYDANIATVPGSSERVEFAIRMPGQNDSTPVYLPIDAKFPTEDYQRLLDAQENADIDATARAGNALEMRVREEAKRIASKYLAPPDTTDFAILFLPTEGLYAEVIRRAGLFEDLQRKYRITLTGPSTLSALLNSLQMGFRTLAIQKRSSEVWNVLAAVKTEFGKFGDVLDKVKKKLDEAGRHIDATGVRTRAIERKLRGVESLSNDKTDALLDQTLSETDTAC